MKNIDSIEFFNNLSENENVTMEMIDDAIVFLLEQKEKIIWNKILDNKYIEKIYEKYDFMNDIQNIDITTLFLKLSKNPDVSEKMLNKVIDILLVESEKIDWNKFSQNKMIGHIFEKFDFIHLVNDEIFWNFLSQNQNAIPILKKYYEKINWLYLCSNPNAIGLLEQNLENLKDDEIEELCNRSDAIHLFPKIIEKLSWTNLSRNNNDNVFLFLSKYPDKICWDSFLYNKNKNALKLFAENFDEIQFSNLLNSNLFEEFEKIFDDKNNQLKKLIKRNKYLFIRIYSEHILFIQWIEKYFDEEDFDSFLLKELSKNETEWLWGDFNQCVLK
jgi:hypothetical protein